MNIILVYAYSPGTTGLYLERALAREHHIIYAGTPWPGKPGYLPNVDLSEVVAALPPEEKPDLCLYIDAGIYMMFPRGLDQLPCPTAAYLIDVKIRPAPRRLMGPFFDYLFVAQKDAVEEYRSLGCPNVKWLPLAVDPDLICALDRPRQFEIGFAGATGGLYKRRTTLLSLLEKRFKLNDYHQYYNQAQMSELYSSSKIVFNNSLIDEVNMRIFEALGTGSLLLTDRIGNGLNDLFKDGEHLVLYDNSDPEGMLAIVDHYLHNDTEREAIASSGRREVLEHHTYEQRAREILTTIFGPEHNRNAVAPELSRYFAPVRQVSKRAVHARYAHVYAMLGLLFATITEVRALQNFPSRPRRGLIFGFRVLLLAFYRRFKKW